MNTIKLYHGSKSGIKGSIKPSSRPQCDFGVGFYMCTNPLQVKSLVFEKEDPYFYELQIDMEEIPSERILTLSGMEWAWVVLFNRGELDIIKNSSLYQTVSKQIEDKDIIIGPIADDNMRRVIQQFIDGDITDRAMLECIRCIDYGTQYAVRTVEACSKISILSSRPITLNDFKDLQEYRNSKRQESNIKVDMLKKNFRNTGKYFDELIDEMK